MSLIKPKVVVVMPAYNAAQTLRMTYAELPHDSVDLVIVVDDGSSDETAAVARELGLELFVHNRNYGYGAGADSQADPRKPGTYEGTLLRRRVRLSLSPQRGRLVRHP